MELFTPPDTDMELPIGDDPAGGPDLAKVDHAGTLFYRYGHADRHPIYTGGQTLYRSDRTWFTCVRDAPAGQSVSWLLYAFVDRAIGISSYKTEPISALEFAQAMVAQGRTVVVRKYDNYNITYHLDGESVPL
ncbi:hypothetical protein [Nonomuraea basaltis]|uniref:hypothetical protein n=1 Tax=Nonomuraea basaltis TaxID=2495887 RepID=UPI00110C6899|nr:hypothetical protein [Nonomuraea basaltis]TMR99505.1 hypothetical protein EJK15_06745 [Nonomuraea basaltis]